MNPINVFMDRIVTNDKLIKFMFSNNLCSETGNNIDFSKINQYLMSYILVIFGKFFLHRMQEKKNDQKYNNKLMDLLSGLKLHFGLLVYIDFKNENILREFYMSFLAEMNKERRELTIIFPILLFNELQEKEFINGLKIINHVMLFQIFLEILFSELYLSVNFDFRTEDAFSYHVFEMNKDEYYRVAGNIFVDFLKSTFLYTNIEEEFMYRAINEEYEKFRDDVRSLSIVNNDQTKNITFVNYVFMKNADFVKISSYQNSYLEKCYFKLFYDVRYFQQHIVLLAAKDKIVIPDNLYHYEVIEDLDEISEDNKLVKTYIFDDTMRIIHVLFVIDDRSGKIDEIKPNTTIKKNRNSEYILIFREVI